MVTTTQNKIRQRQKEGRWGVAPGDWVVREAGVTSSRGTKRNSHATMQTNAIQADELQWQGSGGGQQPGPCLHRKISAAGMHNHGRRHGADDTGPWHPGKEYGLNSKHRGAP